MTARHCASETPRACVEPLPGAPTPGAALRAAAATLPVTDVRGYLLALSHAYDTRPAPTVEEQADDLAQRLGRPANYVRSVLGLAPIPPTNGGHA